MKRMIAIFSATLLAGTALGSGFQLFEQGAQALGVGGAYTAVATDPSAVFYNPAGLSFQKNSVQLGTSVIMPTVSFTGPTDHPDWGTHDMEKQTFTPSTFYANYRLGSQASFGMGVYTPFGLGSRWAEDWLGHYITEEINLMTFDFNPTVAWKLNDRASVGFGVNYLWAWDLVLSKDSYVTPVDTDVDLNIEGTAAGWGWNFGLMMKPIDMLDIGVAWRSGVTLEGTSGTATFEYESTGRADYDAFLASTFAETDVSTTLEIPDMLSLGMALKPLSSLTVSMDAMYTGWEAYDTLHIDFENENDAVTDAALPKLYHNTWKYSFGLEYQLNPQLALRAGYYLDHSPISDDMLEPSLPDADRDGYSFGAGYRVNDHLSVDAYYLMLAVADRTSTFEEFPGWYQNDVNIFGFALTYGL